jgi:hypothetical protein
MRDTIISNADAAKSNADAAKSNADAVAHIDRQILALEDTLYNPQEDNSDIRQVVDRSVGIEPAYFSSAAHLDRINRRQQELREDRDRRLSTRGVEDVGVAPVVGSPGVSAALQNSPFGISSRRNINTADEPVVQRSVQNNASNNPRAVLGRFIDSLEYNIRPEDNRNIGRLVNDYTPKQRLSLPLPSIRPVSSERIPNEFAEVTEIVNTPVKDLSIADVDSAISRLQEDLTNPDNVRLDTSRQLSAALRALQQKRLEMLRMSPQFGNIVREVPEYP